VKYLLSFLLIAITTNILAVDSYPQINAILASEAESGSNAKEVLLHEGDVFRARLYLWPVSQSLEKRLTALADKNLGDGIYVVESDLIMRSPNNPDLISIDLVLALMDVRLTGKITLPSIAGDLPLKLRGLKFAPSTLKIKKIEFIPYSEFDISLNTGIWLVGIILFGIILLVALRVYRQKGRDDSLPAKEKCSEDHLELLRKGEWSRCEIEEIYRTRDRWLDDVTDRLEETENILQQIDSIQYHPEWSQAELDQISNSLKEIGRDL
jgi:hypothetical protein